MRDFVTNLCMLLAWLSVANAGYILVTGEGAARWILIIGSLFVAAVNGLMWKLVRKKDE